MRQIYHKGISATQTEEGKAWEIKLPSNRMSFIGTDEELNKFIDTVGDIFMVNRKDRELPGWEAYAIDACQLLLDHTFVGISDKDNWMLERAKSNAKKAMELWRI